MFLNATKLNMPFKKSPVSNSNKWKQNIWNSKKIIDNFGIQLKVCFLSQFFHSFDSILI